MALTVSLLAVVFLLTFHLYYESRREVLSDFQRDQLSYAKHLSNQIQFYFQARSRGLRALSSLASFQSGDSRQQRLDIQAYAKQLEEVHVRAVSLYNKMGTAVYSTDPQFISGDEGAGPFFVWAQKKENRGKAFLTPVFLASPSLTFTLAVPILQDARPSQTLREEEDFLGVLAFTLDMKGFLANRLGITDPSMSLDRIWIVDNNGTLLFQQDHPEMVSRNIYQGEANCRRCHASFDHVEEILGKRQGTLEYQIKNSPQKIAVFVPMDFENASWVVVVNTPYDQVTGFIRKSLRNHLFLLGVIILAGAIGSMIVIRNERMKIRSEEKVDRKSVV